MIVHLSDQQRKMTEIIRSECEREGVLWLYEAAVANAYAESLLNPGAVGDRGLSIGLFQLHARGAGRGMSEEERRNPVLNTRRILSVVAGPDGDGLRRMYADGAGPDDLAAEFAHSIERCAACGHQAGDSELKRRRDLVWSLFPPSREPVSG